MNGKPVESAVPVILVVDDMPANAEMLSLMLKEKGYAVRTALGGKPALQSVREKLPDLILLDINMPEMSGYQVCGRLKSEDLTRDIPVIFISSLSETDDKVNAFKAGGVDYVEKPFRLEEVIARIDTHLKIRRLQNELSQQNQRLEELVRERTGLLFEAYRRLAIMDRTKSEFLNLISHELRTPLNGIFGIAELLFNEDEKDPSRRELKELFNISRGNMMRILDDALLLTQIEVSGDKFSPETSHLDFILYCAINSHKAPGAREISILPESKPDGISISGDTRLLVRAFSSLLETATRFSSEGPVTVACRKMPAEVEISVCAKGRTIPADMLPGFFEVFSVSKPIKGAGDLGLGPPVAKRIISLFGGSVEVGNDDSAGVTFTVRCRTA